MTDDDPLGPKIHECPLCHLAGLRERIYPPENHDCTGLEDLERKRER